MKSKLFLAVISASICVALLFSACTGAPAPTTPTPPTTPPVSPEPTPTTPPTPPAANEPVVDEWILPVLTPLTGGFSSWGIETSWAMDEAVKDINAEGGIRGIPLRLEYYDTATDEAMGHMQASKALTKEPLVVAMIDVGGAYLGAMPLIVEEKVFAVAPSPGAIQILEYRPWCCCNQYYDEWQCGATAAAWASREPDIKTVVSIYDNTIEGNLVCSFDQRDWLKEAGLEVVGEVSIDQFATTDYGPVAVAALENNPDGFITCLIGDAHAKVLIELNKRGMKEPRRVMAWGAADYPEFYDVGGEFINGSYIAAFYDRDCQRERWQSILQRYEAHTDIPMGLGTNFAYPVPWLFKDAIEANEITGDPAKLAEERQLLADWLYNHEDFPFLMADADVIDGFATLPIFLCQIQNNSKVAVETVYPDTSLPMRPGLPEW